MSRDLDFTPYTVVASPLPTREARSWRSGVTDAGVTTASHSLQLATDKNGAPFILVEHGGGREVHALSYGTWGVPAAALAGLASLPERELYAVLYSIHDMITKAAAAARDQTALRYGHAFLQGRMKKRKRRGSVSLHIETGWFAVVNGVEAPHPSFKTPEEAMASAKARAASSGLPESAASAIGRA